MRVYCIGKGPSELTVQAPLSGVSIGQSMIIQGTVTDVCAGAKAKVASGEFQIVPAMSDASQHDWMAYIHQQKPMPTDAVGVPVTIFATNENGETEQIATVTSDTSGLFYYKWLPSETGSYLITAVFDGSNSYYGSSATTAVSVDEAPTQPVVSPTPTETVSPTQTIATSPTPAATEPGTGVSTETILIAVAAAVIVIAVIASAIFLRKRK
ncbi:MAG: hypothetical protein GX638_08245 [Crenarchaeota archaeon]|nr:hypothetical protein [Thermoproteota archaeon]